MHIILCTVLNQLSGASSATELDLFMRIWYVKICEYICDDMINCWRSPAWDWVNKRANFQCNLRANKNLKLIISTLLTRQMKRYAWLAILSPHPPPNHSFWGKLFQFIGGQLAVNGAIWRFGLKSCNPANSWFSSYLLWDIFFALVLYQLKELLAEPKYQQLTQRTGGKTNQGLQKLNMSLVFCKLNKKLTTLRA